MVGKFVKSYNCASLFFFFLEKLSVVIHFVLMLVFVILTMMGIIENEVLFVTKPFNL